MEVEIPLLTNQWVIQENGKEIKKFLVLNKNKDTTYKNLRKTAKAGLRRKFMVMSAHIRKLEKSQII
jgi:hypothetical protein